MFFRVQFFWGSGFSGSGCRVRVQHLEVAVEKRKVNFKIYDVKTWETNNCHAHIAQYLKKLRQSDNDIWSVNIT